MAKKNDDLRKILSLNIKNHRKTLGLSQEKLAEKAGISANMIKDIEGCRTWVSDKTLIKLAHTLKVDTYRLFVSSSIHDGVLDKTVIIDLIQSIRKIRKEIDIDFIDALTSLAAIAGEEKEPKGA